MAARRTPTRACCLQQGVVSLQHYESVKVMAPRANSCAHSSCRMVRAVGERGHHSPLSGCSMSDLGASGDADDDQGLLSTVMELQQPKSCIPSFD